MPTRADRFTSGEMLSPLDVTALGDDELAMLAEVRIAMIKDNSQLGDNDQRRAAEVMAEIQRRRPK